MSSTKPPAGARTNSAPREGVDFDELLKMEPDGGVTNIASPPASIGGSGLGREPMRGALHVIQ